MKQFSRKLRTFEDFLSEESLELLENNHRLLAAARTLKSRGITINDELIAVLANNSSEV